MTESEMAICALNAEARKRGLSYGQLLVRINAEELKKIIREYKPQGKKKV